MYQVAIKKKITAFHQLIGGDWGRENEHHSHDYEVELIIEGASLDRHGYLFDIAELRVALARVHERYSGKTLNDFDEMKNLNPSVERFAKEFAVQLCRGLKLAGASHLTVKMWEDDDTWASFRTSLPMP